MKERLIENIYANRVKNNGKIENNRIAYKKSSNLIFPEDGRENREETIKS